MSKETVKWEVCDPRNEQSAANIGEENFRRIAELICEQYQADMLPKSSGDLLERFRARRLIGIRPNKGTEELVASCNLDPLFDQAKAMQIFGEGVCAEIEVPKIVELGGVIVAPEYQGHGLGELMAYTILREHEEEISKGRMLVVLTTKHAAMLMTVLPKVGTDLSEVKATISKLGFRAYRHDEQDVRMIGALTCTCESNLGNGYGYADATTQGCPKRTKGLRSTEDVQGMRIWLKEQFEENNGHIDCTMAVSSGSHAGNFSQGLENALQRVSSGDPFNYFINRLRASGYYGERFARKRINYADERCC